MSITHKVGVMPESLLNQVKLYFVMPLLSEEQLPELEGLRSPGTERVVPQPGQELREREMIKPPEEADW